MAALAMPSEVELNQLSKNDLVGALQSAFIKLKSQKARITKLGGQLKDGMKAAAFELPDFACGVAGGAAAGGIMGAIQAKILAGEEGYDEESLILWGLPYDAWATVVLAVSGFAMSKSKASWAQTGARYVKGAALGASGALAGRMAYEHMLAPDEEEGAQQTA